MKQLSLVDPELNRTEGTYYANNSNNSEKRRRIGSQQRFPETDFLGTENVCPGQTFLSPAYLRPSVRSIRGELAQLRWAEAGAKLQRRWGGREDNHVCARRRTGFLPWDNVTLTC